jgi:hypothetical protein
VIRLAKAGQERETYGWLEEGLRKRLVYSSIIHDTALYVNRVTRWYIFIPKSLFR